MNFVVDSSHISQPVYEAVICFSGDETFAPLELHLTTSQLWFGQEVILPAEAVVVA